MNVETFRQPLMIEIGGRLSYVNTGITTAPDPIGTVLCLHEFTAGGTMFQPLADQLAASGWKVVAPDMPGRGQSHRLPSELYVWHTYVHVLAAVLRLQSRGPLVIVGVGWGAMLAVGLENLWRPKPAKMVLCDLPLTWRFAQDQRGQLMVQLCKIIAQNDDEFMDQARQAARRLPDLEADVLQDVARRLTGPVGARSLGTDPKIYDTLPHDPNAVFSTAPMLRACTTPTELLYSKTVPSLDDVAAFTEQSRHITARRIAATSFCDWSLPSIFGVVQDAIRTAHLSTNQ